MTPPVIPDWSAPWPTRGSLEFVRVSATHLKGDGNWQCPTQIAAKARPALRQDRDPSLRIGYPPTATFPLGFAREAAVAMLSGDLSVEDALTSALAGAKGHVPAPLRDVAQAALEGYLAVLQRLRDDGELPPDSVVREFFAYDDSVDPDVTRVEWYAWGIVHVSRDSDLREFHVITWDRAGSRPRSQGYLAVCARVAADAVARMPGQEWWRAWDPAPAQPRAGSRVRVREIGVLDGTSALLLDEPLDAVLERFPDVVAEPLEVLAGGAFRPGGHCGTCALRFACPGIARLPGVLGVAGAASPWTRSLSPSDLTAGVLCTWQTHLVRDLGLPRAPRESTVAMQRGAAIHGWLEHAHGRLQPCSLDDLPLDGLGDVAGRLAWSAETYSAVRPYLVQHVDQCLLRREGIVAAYPEQTLTAWDTDVDVVVSTRTDLAAEFEDAIIIRETKSRGAQAEPQTTRETFERFPQVALALVLIADGLDPMSGEAVTGAPARPAYVELELLSPDGAEVVRFDARDPDTVLTARATIAEAVDHLLYTEPAPRPGAWCTWCPVASWCPGQAVAHIVGETLEPEPGRQRMSLLAYSETPLDDAEDIPF